MNLIDIVKNAPEGAERYKVFENGFVEYYALIDGIKKFYSNTERVFKKQNIDNFDNSLPLPKLKTEYRKVEDSIWDLRPEFEAGELYYYQGGDYHKITQEPQLLCHYKHNSIYIRIDKIIDEREEFVKRAMIEHFNRSGLTETILEEMFDSGCRFID